MNWSSIDDNEDGANLLEKLTTEIMENTIGLNEVIHAVGQDDNDC